MGPQSRLIQAASVCVLVIVFLLSVYVRFDRITDQGISPGDNVGYFEVATQWAEGIYDIGYAKSYYRPAAYTFNALAIKTLGPNDYSIKIFNSLVDMLILCLIGVAAYLICGDLLPSAACILLYAFLPRIVEFSRSEMPHTLSTFFITLSLLLFLLALRKSNQPRLFLLFVSLSGLSLGLAANTHAELALLGPVYAIYILMSVYASDRSVKAIPSILRNLGGLAIGFALPYAIGIAAFGGQHVKKVFEKEFLNHTTGPVYESSQPFYLGPVDVLTKSTRWTFESALPILPLFLLASGLCLCLWLWPQGRIRELKVHIPFALIFGYAVLFPLFVGTFTDARGRIFVPLIPILLISITCWYYTFLKTYFGKWSVPVFLLAFASVYPFLPNVLPRGDFNKPSSQREVHDAIAEEVSDQQKLLIVPSIAGHVRGFELDYYFASNAIFLGQIPLSQPLSLEALEELLIGKKVAFAYYHDFIDPRGIDPSVNISKELATWLRPDTGSYSYADEARILRRYFTKNDASRIPLESGRILYDLRKRPLFHNSGFETGTLENWRREGKESVFTLMKMGDPIPFPMEDRNGNGFYWIDTTDPIATRAASSETVQKSDSGGVLRSRPFRIEGSQIGFLIGGSGKRDLVHVALRVANFEHRAPVSGGTSLQNMYWDVADHMGQEATIFIRDLDPSPGAGIRADFFHYRD